MRPERIASLPEHGIAFDTETFCTTKTDAAPPIVVGSAAYLDGDKIKGELLRTGTSKDDARRVYEAIITDPDKILVGANIAYDNLVMIVDAAQRGVDLFPAVFKAYEDERVYDVQIAEMLHAIAEGTLGKNPDKPGHMLRDPVTHKLSRYSLSVCTWLVLGRTNAKENDTWRTRYGELDPLPVVQWPEEARVYPVDDAVNTLEVALGQTGHIQRPGRHRYPPGGPGSDERCIYCHASIYESAKDCVSRAERRRNLHDLSAQVETAFAMHLGAAVGFEVDQAAVVALREKITAGRPERAAVFHALGILKWKREKGALKEARDMQTIKRRVATAYGCTGKCADCAGSGKVRSKTAKKPCSSCSKQRNPIVKAMRAADPALKLGAAHQRITDAKQVPCTTCASTGKVPDGSKLVTCKRCDATGLDLDSATVPRTDGSKCKDCDTTGEIDGEECPLCEGKGVTQGVGTGRDALDESGDEDLIGFGIFQRDQKALTVYLPFLESAAIGDVVAEETEDEDGETPTEGAE